MANTPLNPDLKGYSFNDYRIPIWGDSFNWSWNRPLNQVKYLVIHHTVTAHDASPDYIALLHKNRGWGGIGYHFVITKNGTVHYVGDIGTARANVLNKNEQVIGIAMVGDFTKHLPTAHQILAAHRLCKYFLFNYPPLVNTTSWNNVVGHKELQATACPGSNWKTAGDNMYERIKNGHFDGYPDWEKAKGVSKPEPEDPKPEPAPEPEPPKPEPTPVIITDPTQKVDLGGKYGVVELRQVLEFLDNMGKRIEELEQKPQSPEINTLNKTLSDMAGMIQFISNDIVDIKDRGGVDCSFHINKLMNVSEAVWGKGWSWQKVNRVREILLERY